MNGNRNNNLEATGAQLTDFNSSLSNFMQNMNRDTKENTMEGMNDFYKKTLQDDRHNSDQKPKLEEGSIQFDLNIKGGYDFVSSGAPKMDSKILSYTM